MSARAKGARTVNKVKDYYESEGYLFDVVEKTGRFRKYKDLFSEYCDGFDAIAMKGGVTELVQIKTNTPAGQESYRSFAKTWATRYRKVVVATWYDRQGLRLQYYLRNGKIREVDLRK